MGDTKERTGETRTGDSRDGGRGGGIRSRHGHEKNGIYTRRRLGIRDGKRSGRHSKQAGEGRLKY